MEIDKLAQLFRQHFDTNCKGVIPRSVMWQILRHTCKFDDAQIDAVLEGFATRQNDGINYYDFFSWLSGSQWRPSKALATDSKKLAPLVVCGPSGVGKSTLFKMLEESLPADFNKRFKLAVQDTTRPQRPGEENGKDYWFVSSLDEFNENEQRGDYDAIGVFVRDEKQKYGFRAHELDTKLNSEIQKWEVPILDIDVARARKMKDRNDIDACYVFVLPKDADQLETRIRGRDGKSKSGEALEVHVKARLAYSMNQAMEALDCRHVWDLVVVNDDKEVAFQSFRNTVLQFYSK